MRQIPFNFVYSMSVKRDRIYNLSIHVYAIAHVNARGEYHHHDFDYFEHEGLRQHPDFLWLSNLDLYEEIDGATQSHGEGIFSGYDFSPVNN